MPVGKVDDRKIKRRDVRGQLFPVFLDPGVEDACELLIAGRWKCGGVLEVGADCCRGA